MNACLIHVGMMAHVLILLITMSADVLAEHQVSSQDLRMRQVNVALDEVLFSAEK